MRNKISNLRIVMIAIVIIAMFMLIGCGKSPDNPSEPNPNPGISDNETDNDNTNPDDGGNTNPDDSGDTGIPDVDDGSVKIIEFDVPITADVQLNQYYEFPFIMAVGSNNENYKPVIFVYYNDNDVTNEIIEGITRKIKITKGGKWRIDYTVTIGEQQTTKSTQIIVDDAIIPNITIDSYEQMQSINATVTLPNITVNDNSGMDILPVIEKIFVNGNEIENTIQDNKLILNQYGKYLIIVSATDGAGNCAKESIVYYIKDNRQRFGIIEDFELLLPSSNEIFTDEGTSLVIDDKNPTNCRLRWMGEGLWPSLYISKSYLEKIVDKYEYFAVDVMLDEYEGAEKTDVYFMFDKETYGGESKHIGANEKTTLRISTADLEKIIAKMPSTQEKEEKLKNTIKIGINNKSSSQMVNIYLDNFRGEYKRKDIFEINNKYGIGDGLTPLVDSAKINNMLPLFNLELNCVMFKGQEITNGIVKGSNGYVEFNKDHDTGIYTVIYDTLPKDLSKYREGKLIIEINFNAPSQKIGDIENFENLNLSDETHIRNGEANGIDIVIQNENGDKKLSATRKNSDWVSVFIENGYFNKINYDIYDYLSFEITNKSPKDCYYFVRSPNVSSSINGIAISSNKTITVCVPVNEIQQHFNKNGFIEIHLWSNNIENKCMFIDNIRFTNKDKEISNRIKQIDINDICKNYIKFLTDNNIQYSVIVTNLNTNTKVNIIDNIFDVDNNVRYTIVINPVQNALYQLSPYSVLLDVKEIIYFSSNNATCSKIENGVNIKADGKDVSTLIIKRDYFSDVNWQNVTKFSFTVNNKSSDGGELRININNVRLATPWLNRVEATFTVDAKQLKDNLDKFPNDDLTITFASGVINMNLDYYDFKFI